MAYDSRVKAKARGRTASYRETGANGAKSASRAQGKPYESDVKSIVPFGVGILVGAAIGVAAALLLAPASGEDTREWITDRATSISERSRSAWDDLADELQRVRRKTSRAATRTKWWMEDRVE